MGNYLGASKKMSEDHCLCDDLLLEIIVRLPLKSALRCMCLNKAFCGFISNPRFVQKHALLSNKHKKSIVYCSYHQPKIFSNLVIDSSPDSNTCLVRSSDRTLATKAAVLASSNGLLLLLFKKETLTEHYYIHVYVLFNPITGGVARIHIKNQSRNWHQGRPGLVVDPGLDNPFKLVMISGKLSGHVIFDVINGPSWKYNDPPTFMECSNFAWQESDWRNKYQPVYMNGSLHWLGDDGLKILAFDVRKERGRVMDGPVRNRKNRLESSWFGEVEGSLSFVYNDIADSGTKIIKILVHDYANDNWRIKHNITLAPDAQGHRINLHAPVNFDGRWCLFLDQTAGKRTIHAFDVKAKRWRKNMVKVNYWSDCKILFFSLSPTLLKFSNNYLQNVKSSEVMITESLSALQNLFRIIN